MTDRLNAIRELPFHRYLGVAELHADNGAGRLLFTVSEATVNPAGVLHGGVIYTLCDVCAYAGLTSMLAPGTEAVTHDIHVSVLRAAKLGEVVSMTSAPVKIGRSLCFLDVTAKVNDRIVATARVTKTLVNL